MYTRNEFLVYMSTTLRLQEWTKERLSEFKERENHTSHDSSIKGLLRDHELLRVLQNKPYNTTTTRTIGGAVGPTWGPEAYVGGIGSGKTYTTKVHARDLIEEPNSVSVFIIDPLNSYNVFATDLDATILDETTQRSFTPFDFQRGDTKQSSLANAITEKSTFIADHLTLTAQVYAEQEETLEILERQSTTQLIQAVVENIIKTTSSEHDSENLSDIELSLNTLQDEFDQIGTDNTDSYHSLPDRIPDSEGKKYPIEITARTLSDILDVIENESQMGENSLISQRNREREIDNVVHAPLPQELMNSNSKTVSWRMATELLTFFEMGKSVNGPVVIFIDEAHHLTSNPYSQRILAEVMSVGRKYNISTRPVFQKTVELLTEDETSVMEWDRVHFHQCSLVDGVVSDSYGFSDGQHSFLQHADKGSTDNASEQLIYDVVNDVKTIRCLSGNT